MPVTPPAVTPPAIADSVMAKIVTALSGNSAPTSVVAIIKLVTRATSSKAEALAALHRLAAGPDGVSGTSDDIIPQEAVSALTFLVNSGVAEDIVALVAPLFPFSHVLRIVGRLWTKLVRGPLAAAA